MLCSHMYHTGRGVQAHYLQIKPYLYKKVTTPDSMARCDSSSTLSDTVEPMTTNQQGLSRLTGDCDDGGNQQSAECDSSVNVIQASLNLFLL